MGRLARILNLDRAVKHTLLFRLWTVFVGLINLAVIPFTLSASQQGYYYTYGSILALQVFFELGLNQVISQFASHEAAHFDITKTVQNHQLRHHNRLVSLVKMLRRWYAGMAIAFAILVGTGGAMFFYSHGTIANEGWLYSWVVLVAASACNLYLSPSLAFLEGCGQVANVAKLRFKQSLLGSALMWGALAGGAGLNAVAVIPSVAAVATYFWLRKNGTYIAGARKMVGEEADRINWYAEIFPLQWRISLSWISGYLIFNLVAPLAFARLGPVAAGQIGISFAVFNSITSIGMSWVNAKAPSLSMLAAERSYHAMNALFWSALKTSMTAILSASAVFILCAVFLREFLPNITGRLLPPDTLIWLALAALCNSAVFSGATFMRSFKKEPMLANSIVTGIITAVCMYFAAETSPRAMVITYVGVLGLICLPWTIWLFIKFYKAPPGRSIHLSEPHV